VPPDSLSLLDFPLVDISLHTHLSTFIQRRDTYRRTGAHGLSYDSHITQYHWR
jgi:hypothetical protein